jgi:hypothetical protein
VIVKVRFGLELRLGYGWVRFSVGIGLWIELGLG